jgi:hypothetical protein
MGSSPTLTEMLARLEAQIAYHREEEARHARAEEEHRAERARHAAALVKATEGHAALQAAAAGAAEMVASPAPAPQEVTELAPRDRSLVRLIARVLPEIPPQDSFGASRITRELERRFGAALRRSVDSRMVAMTLARLARRGRLHQVRRGRPHWEALYTREQPRCSVECDAAGSGIS